MSYRWAVLAAGTAAQASFSSISFAIAVLAPALREEYDLSLTQIGVVLAAEWVGLTIALLPWGFAVDRWGERWTLASGLVLCAAFLAAAAYAPSFEWLVVLLGLAGAAGGSVQSGSGRAVMRWFSARERGLALGVRQTAVPIGGAVAALVLPVLETPRAGLLFVAGFVLAGAIAGALVLRAGTEEHLEATDVEITLRDRRLWLACWGSGLYLVAQVAMMGFVVLFLHDEHGFSTGAAAAVFAVGQGLAAALRIGVGHWSDVLGLAGAAAPRDRRRDRRRARGRGGALELADLAARACARLRDRDVDGLERAFVHDRRRARRPSQRRCDRVPADGASAIGIAAPVAFAAMVSGTSWSIAFALAAVFPLAGAWLLRPLAVQ